MKQQQQMEKVAQEKLEASRELPHSPTERRLRDGMSRFC